MNLRPLCLMFIYGSVFAPAMIAQNSTQLFGPVNVRPSQSGAGYGASQVTFDTNTLNLTCPASPSAVLSSSASAVPSSSSGNIVVDNNINVTNLTTGSGPVNVCKGGTANSLDDGATNCFTANYENSAGSLIGVDPDTFVASGGVPPIDISGLLIAGSQQIKIDLVDQGGELASSTVYLNSNCTYGGVNGPATISGNTIPPTNPTPAQLDQDFTFNPTSQQLIGFEYNLTGAQSAGTLTVNPDGAIPQVTDSGLDSIAAYPLLVGGTSFSTSMCLVHNGELLNGLPACKLFTLECATGTGNSSSGAQCPVSTMSNEVLSDTFDGPAFTLPDIATPGGSTFHTGMGFLMASEVWAGGPCTFDPASRLQASLCPQNLLTNFSGPGTFSSAGQTTHPNSTFISVAQVPEDLTSVTVTDSQGNPVSLGPGNWTNNPYPYVKLSSQPPNLAGTGLPGAADFVAAPIRTVTYGISPGTVAPMPGTTSGTDTVLTNPLPCPSPTSPGSPAAVLFTPPVQSVASLQDGNYLLHYYAQDCAGTEELRFIQDASGSWSTNFYTFPINVDTIAPEVASGPTLSPAGPYYQGQVVTATYSCTDERSGVVRCGNQVFAAGTLATGTVSETVPTSSSGAESFTVVALDAAGNQSSQSVNYQVNVDSHILLTVSSSTITYPLGTNTVVQISSTNGHAATGTAKIMENGTILAKLNLNNGAAYYYLSGLSPGLHNLYAVYSGDAYNAAGNSAPVTLNVLPVPVTLSLSCWNTPSVYGPDFHCGAYTSSAAGAPLGSITYAYDSGTSVTLPLANGSVNFTIPEPQVGNHTIVVTYPAQTNYAAATTKTQTFTVTPAPVVIHLTPSAWYLTGGNLTLSASIQTWSTSPPNATGTVTFTYGGTVLAVVPVSSTGTATAQVPASVLRNGSDVLSATYSGSTNYASGSASINVQVAQ